MRQNKLVQKRENEVKHYFSFQCSKNLIDVLIIQLRIAREECDHMFDSIHCMDFLDKNVLINQKNTNEVNRKDTGPGKRAQCRKSKADAMISSSRPDIMLELDKQVCDLVRQQQHASLSYGAQKCDESELALTMMQDENNPVRNCICATDFRGLPDGANLAKLTVVDGCKREGSHEAVSELEVRQARSKTKRFTADRPAFPVKLETWK